MREIQLGDTVRDMITGFEGVVIAKVEALFGVPKCEVQQRNLDGNDRPFESIWFPTGMLELKQKPIHFSEDGCRVTPEELNEAGQG